MQQKTAALRQFYVDFKHAGILFFDHPRGNSRNPGNSRARLLDGKIAVRIFLLVRKGEKRLVKQTPPLSLSPFLPLPPHI